MLLIEATRVADPASVGVVIGAAPLVIVIAAAVAARQRPGRRLLLAAAVVTVGSAAAQLGGAAGVTWSGTGLLLSLGALGGAAGSSLLAAPVLPRLGGLAVTVYACGLRITESRLRPRTGCLQLLSESPLSQMPGAVSCSVAGA